MQKKGAKAEPAPKPKSKKKEVPPSVEANDLSQFNTSRKQLIGDQENKDMLKNLFVTEDENAVMEQFEHEKHKELENELGAQVKVPEVKRGWNEWAGDGVDNRKHDEKVARAQAIKNKRIQELKQKRADFKMKGIIVNTEERDKKFAHKYWVKELPHPYNSVDQHQKVMNMPIGKEWSTLQTYKRLV